MICLSGEIIIFLGGTRVLGDDHFGATIQTCMLNRDYWSHRIDDITMHRRAVHIRVLLQLGLFFRAKLRLSVIG